MCASHNRAGSYNYGAREMPHGVFWPEGLTVTRDHRNVRALCGTREER